MIQRSSHETYLGTNVSKSLCFKDILYLLVHPSQFVEVVPSSLIMTVLSNLKAYAYEVCKDGH